MFVPFLSTSAAGTPLAKRASVDVDHQYPEKEDLTRPTLALAVAANWLSVIGSLIIILYIPQVIQRVPSQRKRMLIVLFTAISNFGFSFVNIITDYADAITYLPCSVSAWCYVFFQLLTCTLVTVSTFRLCGVFLFTERRSIPSKYIALCPLVAFVLATMPAAFKQYDFNECAHYCWFEPVPGQKGCRIISLWAWLCYYTWMIVLLSILLGSTLFVLSKIAITVMNSRWNLKQVVDQSFNPVTNDATPTPARSNLSTFHNEGIQTRENQQPTGTTRLNNEQQTFIRNTTSIPRTNERLFLLAIFRQALYPISISVTGGIQIAVDVTLSDFMAYNGTLDYVANIATSIQGFLFFLVFMFDPAVMQMHRHWRKYMIWKYYVEFYYSLEMPREGRDFEDRFMERCQTLNQPGSEVKFDLLTKPPPYSWSLQYDDLAMPSDFQTTYPLTIVGSASNTQPQSHLAPSHQYRGTPVPTSGREGDTDTSGLISSIPEDDETSTQSPSPSSDLNHPPPVMLSALGRDSDAARGTRRMDYTYSLPVPSSAATQRHRDKDTIRPLVRTTIPSDAYVRGDNTLNTIPSTTSRLREARDATILNHSCRPARHRNKRDPLDSDLDGMNLFDSELDEDIDLERAPRRTIAL
ncbi:hypothetical protein BGZ65_009325, partial [Modicella reniformis]